MKRMRANFLITLIFMTLTFSPILQFSHSAAGAESKPDPCWPTYQSDKDTLSAQLRVLRTYALPPAWGSLNRGQEEPSIHQAVAKWEARMAHRKVLNYY